MLHKDIIPVSLWQKTQALVVGLGNIPNEISFQISEAVLCFQVLVVEPDYVPDAEVLAFSRVYTP